MLIRAKTVEKTQNHSDRTQTEKVNEKVKINPATSGLKEIGGLNPHIRPSVQFDIKEA